MYLQVGSFPDVLLSLFTRGAIGFDYGHCIMKLSSASSSQHDHFLLSSWSLCVPLQGGSGGLRAVGEDSPGEGVCTYLSHHAPAAAESNQWCTGSQSLRRTMMIVKQCSCGWWCICMKAEDSVYWDWV